MLLISEEEQAITKLNSRHNGLSN